MKSFCLFLLLTILFLTSAPSQSTNGQALPDEPLDVDAWLDDFEHLQHELASHYSTFEWQRRTRKMDLRQLAQRTRDEIRAAKDLPAAKIALRRFLAAFGDGHLAISWPNPSGSSGPSDQRPLCKRLRYGDERGEPGIPFTALPFFRVIHTSDERYFPIGVLSAGQRRIGVLRIGLFEETPFLDLCQTATAALEIKESDSCDRSCEDRIEAYAGNLLTEALTRQIRALAIARIDFLAIDITANASGNNWGEPAARVLTRKKIFGSRYGFIRHPHWVKNLTDDLKALEADSYGLSGRDSDRVERAKPVVKQAIAEASKTCDLMPLWRNDSVNCTLVVDSPLFVTGMLPYAAPGTLPDRPSSHVLFKPSRYKYTEGVYQGPLAILVDEDTGSTAERVGAMLKDNGAATILGTPTTGAGCGYTNGGIPVTLARTGARVKMPDCVQFRRDGSNLVEGITPDIWIPWRYYDAPYQRAMRAAEALKTWVRSSRKTNRRAHASRW